MRAAPVAGDSQVRVIRTCASCAHAPDDRPARTAHRRRVATLDGAIAALRAGGLRVSAARLEPVRALVREAFGFEARFGHFPIVGLCPACARR
jgi:hypothetical protein